MASIVYIAGNLGSGKSTLAAGLGAQDGWKLIAEREKPIDYLTDLFNAPERWAFETQIAFLTSKVDAVLQAEAAATRFAVVERSIYEHFEVFVRAFAAYGALDARAVRTFERLSGFWIDVLPPPVAVIVCKCPPEVCEQRVLARLRPTDPAYPPGHVKRLGDLLCEWLARFEGAPVLTLDTLGRDVRLRDVHASVAVQIAAIASSTNTQRADLPERVETFDASCAEGRQRECAEP